MMLILIKGSSHDRIVYIPGDEKDGFLLSVDFIKL